MLHEPAAQAGVDHATAYKMKLGVRLFVVYAVLYFVGFVGISVLKPTLMEKSVLFGMNLAVVFGFGLIVVALVLALVYNRMCTKKEAELNGPATEEGE